MSKHPSGQNQIVKTTNLPLDGAAGGVPVVPGLESGAGQGPRHQGAALPPAQGDGTVQEAPGGLHPSVYRLAGQFVTHFRIFKSL